MSFEKYKISRMQPICEALKEAYEKKNISSFINEYKYHPYFNNAIFTICHITTHKIFDIRYIWSNMDGEMKARFIKEIIEPITQENVNALINDEFLVLVIIYKSAKTVNDMAKPIVVDLPEKKNLIAKSYIKTIKKFIANNDIRSTLITLNLDDGVYLNRWVRLLSANHINSGEDSEYYMKTHCKDSYHKYHTISKELYNKYVNGIDKETLNDYGISADEVFDLFD